MSISFRFDNLEYQRQAVNSVISLLEGQSQDANKNTFTKKRTNQLQNYGFPVHSNPSLTLWKFGSNSGNLLDGKSESAALGVWVSIELSIFIDFWHWNGKYFSGYFPFISLVEKKHENIGFIAFPVLSNFCLPT